METYTYIETQISDQIGTLWLNRPDIRNAFNEKMIAEINAGISELENSKQTRIIIIRGRGKSFCSGADLEWMKNVATYRYDQNLAESIQLAACFKKIYACSKPTIALVHGAAMGGANGIIAACDMAYATNETTFSLSEVKIGIIPACISPYIIKRVGEFAAREIMLTGVRFSGTEAGRIRLINKSLPENELDSYVSNVIQNLLSSGPQAIINCKKLIHQVCNEWTFEEAENKTAEMIATIRATPEAQEGMAAFLEKRTPIWISKHAKS